MSDRRNIRSLIHLLSRACAKAVFSQSVKQKFTTRDGLGAERLLIPNMTSPRAQSPSAPAVRHKRARSESPSEHPSKKIKEDQINEVMNMDEFDICQISPFKAMMRCFIQVNTNCHINGSMNARMGYSINVLIDGGRRATPTLSLIFRSNPFGKATEPLTRDQSEQEYFAIEFTPGARVPVSEDAGQDPSEAPFMLDSIHWNQLKDPATHTDLQKMVMTRVREADKAHLIEITLNVAGHRQTGKINEDVWRQYPNLWEDIESTRNGEYVLKMWFRPGSGDESFIAYTLQPFAQSVKQRLRHYHPYFKNGQLRLHLDGFESFENVGNGMYCVYDKDDPDKLQEPKSYLFQPLRHTWDTLEDFQLFQSGHAIREYQFQVSQTTFLEAKDPKKARIRKLPCFKTATREIVALTALCGSEHRICKKLVHLLSKSISEEPEFEVDVLSGTYQNQSDRDEHRAKLLGRIRDFQLSQEELSALEGLSVVRDGISLIQGPSGTGKTTNLARGVWLTTSVGHAHCVFAKTKAALENVTIALHESRPEELKEKKVLYLDYRLTDECTVLQDASLIEESWTEGEEFAHGDRADTFAVEKYLTQLEEIDALLESFLKQTNDYREAFDLLEEQANRVEKQNIPLATTMAYQIWALAQRDKVEAQSEYSEACRRIGQPHKDIAQFERECLGLTSANDRNPSYRFMQYRTRYIKEDRDLQARRELSRLMLEMTARVLKNVSILVVSSRNASSVIAELGFKPTLLWSDDTARSSIVNLAVPITAFDSWIALFMYGDTEQLPPPTQVGQRSEFHENAKLSVMALLIAKGYPQTTFNEQYRMAAEISQFPNHRFYNDLLRNAKVTELPDEVKDRIRAMTLTKYGLQGPEGKGALYWVRNMVFSTARRQQSGNSLQNHTNVNGIDAEIRNLVEYGIAPEQITIITMYKGQVDLVIDKLKAVVNEDGTPGFTRYREAYTADAFQGKQNDVIILDLVVANPKVGYRDTPKRERSAKHVDELDVEEVEGAMDTLSSRIDDRISRYVNNKHRLAAGLTRARYGMVVVVQVAGALWTSLMDKQKGQKSDLAALAEDAYHRQVIYHDKNSRDDHPEAIAERHMQSGEEAERARQLHLTHSFRYVKDHFNESQKRPAKRGSR